MASELIWRRLSEQEKKEIEKKAKGVMESFAKTLDKLPARKEGIVDREVFMREESGHLMSGNDFRMIMFENAPKKDNDCIVAEKGAWVK
ncbi:MAG: hypothetical protein WC781_02155 [Candidatus Pacearchaeota archaeon]|jgi:hypothetical protein